jgi:hypothetical protein
MTIKCTVIVEFILVRTNRKQRYSYDYQELKEKGKYGKVDTHAAL